MSEVRLMFLGSGPAFPESIAFTSRYEHLSKYFSGDVVTPVLRSGSNAGLKVGRFDVHTYSYYEGNALLRNLHSSFILFITAMRMYMQKRHDVIISSNPLTTGVLALLIAMLTGKKAMLEVNGNFEAAFKFGSKGGVRPSPIDVLKDKVSRPLMSFALMKADMVKLVYRDQLNPLQNGRLRRVRTSTFPNFVPIQSFIDAEKADDRYVLLLGYPWYLKGVDILIRAFNKVCHEFPEYRLKIVGWCPEGREFFERLANGNPRIELCDPVDYERVIPLMARCSVYVLASRTDSSPRVLREAMAAGKPIIASDIDGVPMLIRNGYNGLLFRKEDTDDLAEKIRLILHNQSLACELARNGLEYVQKHLSEGVYIRDYRRTIESLLSS